MTDTTPLQQRVTGPVLTPTDPGFTEEVAGFNTVIVNAPEIAVGAASAADVVETVRFARETGLPLRIQATGHGATKAITDGILLTTKRLDSVSVDPATRIATIGAGTRWGAVVAAAAEHGLAPVTGSSTVVGVVGYLLGGGLGPLARSHGYSSDYVQSFSVVTGDGELVEASESNNPELFWALRGGKGGLGVVTEVRIALLELATLYAGSLLFEEENIEAVLRGWIEYTASAPDSVTTSVAIMRLPPFDFIPEPLRGRTLASLRFAFTGDSEQGERLAEPLRALAPVYIDSLGEIAASQVELIHSDPTDPGPGWNRGALLSELDQDFASALLSQLGSGVDAPFVVGELRHLGGATAVDVAGGSATGGRASDFTFMLIGAPNPALFEHVLPSAAEGVFAAIAEWVSPETTINFTGPIRDKAHFESAWPAATHERLIAARTSYDPEGIFAYGRY